VRFSHPLAATPVSVIVTGSSPYIGPGLPLNLISTGSTTAGFGVRALDQTGTPIANRPIRLHYWATVQAATPNTRAGTAIVTPDSRGIGFISWPRLAVGLPPASVVLTGVTPTAGPNMPVNLVASTFHSTGVAIRALNQAGQPITSPVRIAFYATKAPTSPL
jgi:type 1 fimbria pilin